MRKWKPNTRATEKSGPQTSACQQHSPWERNVQAARETRREVPGPRVQCQGVLPPGKPPLCNRLLCRKSLCTILTPTLWVDVIIPMSQMKPLRQEIPSDWQYYTTVNSVGSGPV